MTARDRARKKIEGIVRGRGYDIDIWSVASKDGIEQFFIDEVAQILSIPELAVLADDQSLPESPDRKSGSTEGRSFTEGNFLSYSMLPQYELAQQDMWDDGWRKTE